MKILALDTTAKTAGLALAETDRDGKLRLLSSYSLHTGSHSTTLLPMIESMLFLNGLTAADLDLYGVSAGPGSFTGIRIGVSAVKGMAFAHETPCVGISTLFGMAMGFEKLPGLIFPAVDARRNTVYGAAFLSDGAGKVTRLTADEQLEWSDFAALIRETRKDYPDLTCYGCGDGYCVARLEETGVREAPACLAHPTGYGVALAAWETYQNAKDPAVFTDGALSPVYLKKSQAEREREEALEKEANKE